MNRKVRVRFAPSPTGPLHIGGVRTALYNYLFAKKNDGDFILRIEDTDQTRYVKGAEEYIMETFDWLGLKFDEGIREGGNYAPYRQSERKHLYKKYALELVEKGWAYYAFDTSEELDKLRKEYESRKEMFQYDNKTRKTLKNSLTMTDNEVKNLIDNGTNYVIRFKFPENEDIVLNDLIRGEVKYNTNVLDDKVLYKSDGMPTYHLANIVDDHLMEISHVIRGEEWLPSTPLHTLLYKAFGWEDTMPQFAHLPLLLKPVGNGKLSKRDGAKMGFPVFPLQWQDPETNEKWSGYREEGYLKEAVINFLALLGWHSSDDKELYTLAELINDFSIERISKSGARFDIEKAKWFNKEYLLKVDDRVIAEEVLELLEQQGLMFDLDYVIRAVELVKERCVFAKDVLTQGDYFFFEPKTYDGKVIKKRWTAGIEKHILIIRDLLGECVFEKTILNDAVHNYIETNQLNTGQIMNCIRLCLVGEGRGVDIFDIMIMIGKENTLKRMKTATEKIPSLII